jgi:hypothetical protein
MSRRERSAWGALALLLLAAARVPLHDATLHLPVSNDDAIPLLMARGILGGELATILWNQPYNGALDAYLLAPWLAVGSPHTVFRLYEIACGLALVLMTGLLARAAAGERAGWIAIALAAAGTPYMALMAATGPTPNFLVPLLVAAAFLMIAPDDRDHDHDRVDVSVNANGNGHVRFLIAGLLAGLAIWDSFLALPALAGAMAGLLLLLGAPPRPRATAWLVVGAVAGLLPLLVARAVGASGSTPVTAIRPRWLWASGLRDLLRAGRGLFGLDVPLVVDGPERAWLNAPMAAALGVSLAVAILLGATRRRSLPLLGWAGALATAFALSRRTGGDEVRYLFGLVPPVLALCAVGIGRLVPAAPPLGRAAAVLLGVGLVGPWFGGHRAVLAAWRNPSHASVVWQVPPIGPALDRLESEGVRSAYASLQFAARLAVDGGGALVVSQAWNERIPGDPLRFRDEVDLDPAPAWVLSPRLSRGMPRAGGFRQLVAAMGGSFRETPAGALVVFDRFVAPYDESRPVPVEAMAVRAIEGTALPAAVLDRDPATKWTSPAAIARGSGLAVALRESRRLSAVVLAVALDPTPLGVAWVAEADGAVVAQGPARHTLQWVNGAPRAGRQALLVVPIGDRAVREVRLLFQGAGPPLAVSEVFAYGPDEAPQPASGAAARAYDRARAGRWDDAVRLYAEALRAEPHRASHHAALSRARWRAAGRRWLDVESLGDGGPGLVARRTE